MEDLIEAVHSITGGVVCLICALAVYDLTEEIPRQYWIGIRHGTSAKSSRQIKIIRFRDLDLGKIEIELEGTLVPIFDRERTIIDAFRLLSRETAIKALKSAVGNSGQSPSKYTKEFIEKEAVEFMSWFCKPENIYFKRFALERGYPPDELAHFAKKSEVFKRAYLFAKEWQECKIVEGALFNKLTPALPNLQWLYPKSRYFHAV